MRHGHQAQKSELNVVSVQEDETAINFGTRIFVPSSSDAFPESLEFGPMAFDYYNQKLILTNKQAGKQARL